MTKLFRSAPLKTKSDYIAFLKSLELESIYLTECQASFSRENLPKPQGKIPLQGKTEYGDPIIDKNRFTVRTTIEVSASTNVDKPPIATIRASFIVRFSIQSETIDTVLAKRFAKTNIKIVVWPYFREFVQNISSRFGMPPISIPIHVG